MEKIEDGDIVTFDQFSAANPAWSSSSLRWMRFNAASNGSTKAGVWIQQGRRVLINKKKFFKWLLASQQQ